jgi:electron transfer flavoprotein alpha subunit
VPGPCKQTSRIESESATNAAVPWKDCAIGDQHGKLRLQRPLWNGPRSLFTNFTKYLGWACSNALDDVSLRYEQKNGKKDKMNYIVLVKQVPDIKNISEDAWDWEKGILKRGLLDNVCNELDKQAIAFAKAMQQVLYGQIVGLSMGPPFADAVLQYAMSVGADTGILLADRKLSGADTAATAYALAAAIRKIEKDIFKGDRNYVIISGMQSVDGDTAQVPAQIAEDLGIAHIAYATSFSIDKNSRLHVKRITRRGTQIVSPVTFPCTITVTNWTLQPNATFERTRWANSQRLIHWNAADLTVDESRIGLNGSRTTVIKIFSPKDVSTRKCVFESDLIKLAGLLKEAYFIKSKPISQETAKATYQLPAGQRPTYPGEVWVFAEQEGGEIDDASYELLGKARQLAAQVNTKVGAVLVGRNDLKLQRCLISYGADKVYMVASDQLDEFQPVPYTRVVCELLDKYKPQIMLFSATPLGRELAPRVAYRACSGLTADCTGLDIIDCKKGPQEYIAILRQTRPALGGNIMASIINQNSKVQMSTVRPGVMQALKPDGERAGEMVKYEPNLDEEDFTLKIVSSEEGPSASELKDASIIVAGGRGCKTKEGFDSCIPALAKSLSDFLVEEAMVGASRVAVEMGFSDRSHQVGQTGQTVKPKLYVAVGISGAVQHISGMQNSDLVLAINKDPNANIFRTADFGIVGDLEEQVPRLIKALNSLGVTS